MRSDVERWITIYVQDGKVVLDIFPYEPGGTTLHLPPDVAIKIAERLLRASQETA